jgi:hypothetical protein
MPKIVIFEPKEFIIRFSQSEKLTFVNEDNNEEFIGKILIIISFPLIS